MMQSRVMASLSASAVEFSGTMVMPKRVLSDSFGWKSLVDRRLEVDRLSRMLVMEEGSGFDGKVSW